MKRFLGLMLLMLCSLAALAETAETIEYRGIGAVERESGSYRARGLIEELNVAYLECDQPFLAKGRQAKWTVVASGGDGIYDYEFQIYHRKGQSGLFSWQGAQSAGRANTFFHTPSQFEGQYMLVVKVTDEAGASVTWQSQVFEMETGSLSPVAKAREVVNLCLAQAGSGDYERALWLHDWLTANADYDYTYTYYYADGVLMHGTGVCQSYAFAYKMMLEMIGIESIYITGEGGGGSHGWNLVKLGGQWYHVDVTWDDPAPGYENHTYFMVTDGFISRDHTWDMGSGVMPECTDGAEAYEIIAGAVSVDGAQAVRDALSRAVENRETFVALTYTGEDPLFSMGEIVSAWISDTSAAGNYNGVSYRMNGAGGYVLFVFGEGFPDIEKAQSIGIREKTLEMLPGDSARLTVLTLPDGAGLSGVTFESSRPSVASVENGCVSALAPGKAQITARLENGKSASVEVYVRTIDVLTLPGGLTSIEEEAFKNVSGVQTIVLPDGLVSIGARAFMGCAALCSIVIPESVSFIGEDAFSQCEDAVLCVAEGSAAHSYALENGLAYEIMQ